MDSPLPYVDRCEDSDSQLCLTCLKLFKTKIGSETADFYNSVKIILKLLCSVSFGLNWSHNKKENKLVFAELPKINTQKK